MDNQASSHTFEWLAGFCDADGSINIRRTNVRRRKAIDYTPEILFSNKSILIINNIISLLDCFGVNKYVYTNSKGVTSIYIKRFTKILSLLNEMEVYLLTKRELAFLIRGFCISRLDSILCNDRSYSDYQLSLYKTTKHCLKELNSKAKLAGGLEHIPLINLPNFEYMVTPSWLAGFMDGDGSFTVVKQRRSGGRVDLYPRINITNCSLLTIKMICNFLLVQGVCYSVQKRKRKKTLPWYEINIQSSDSIKRTVHIVKPFLVGKKEQASLLYRFCDSKLQDDRETTIRLRDRIVELNTLCGASETNA